jgi:hypothetical protein
LLLDQLGSLISLVIWKELRDSVED